MLDRRARRLQRMVMLQGHAEGLIQIDPEGCRWLLRLTVVNSRAQKHEQNSDEPLLRPGGDGTKDNDPVLRALWHGSPLCFFAHTPRDGISGRLIFRFYRNDQTIATYGISVRSKNSFNFHRNDTSAIRPQLKTKLDFAHQGRGAAGQVFSGLLLSLEQISEERAPRRRSLSYPPEGHVTIRQAEAILV